MSAVITGMPEIFCSILTLNRVLKIEGKRKYQMIEKGLLVQIKTNYVLAQKFEKAGLVRDDCKINLN